MFTECFRFSFSNWNFIPIGFVPKVIVKCTFTVAIGTGFEKVGLLNSAKYLCYGYMKSV